MRQNSPFSKSHPIAENNLGSCKVYYLKPGGHEPKHYHHGLEIVYVLKGSCATHKQGQVYLYRKEEVHEVFNDSDKELALVCLTIPPESETNTHYLEINP